MEVADLLTVLITTSPCHSHPNTDLLDKVMGTFLLVPGLKECRKIIICDGYNVTSFIRYKKGKVTSEEAEGYEEYKKRLQNSIDEGKEEYQNTELLELASRFGFGFALKEAFPLVTTPFVMVIQHDRSFRQGFDLLKIMQTMQHIPKMKCVLIPLASTNNYRKRMDTKFFKFDMLVGYEIEYDDLYFLPLCQFYDSTHIATVEFYKDFIFGKKMVPKNGFIEDKLGQTMVRDIRENGMKAHEKYGTYLYGDGFGYLVQHLDGRDGMEEGAYIWHTDENGVIRRVLQNVRHQTKEESRKSEAREFFCDELPEGCLDMFNE